MAKKIQARKEYVEKLRYLVITKDDFGSIDIEVYDTVYEADQAKAAAQVKGLEVFTGWESFYE